MTPIYGNDDLLAQIRTMAARGRLPHAVLFHGARGMGRKTLARYYAKTALCTGQDAPCGQCASCRKIDHESHPDLIIVPHSGKRSGFSVETVRSVVKDAIVAPNDGARKVYLFGDCDAIDPRSQNTLLKLTEEPPPHVLLVFTAEHRNVFLTTMLSRMMPLAVRPCTEAECLQALEQDHGIAHSDALAAAAACGGNIGTALEWLDSRTLQDLTRAAAALTEAVSVRRQYDILRLLAAFEKDRQTAMTLLRLLDAQVRDSLVLKYGQDTGLMGCDRRSAEALSRTVTASRAAAMHRAIQTAWDALQANVSTRVTLAALGWELLS